MNLVKKDEKIDKAVEEIVTKWNYLVKDFQNTTIKLCLMIRDMLKDYPDESVKEILKRVKEHPNIKRFVSVERIWQGLRLIKNRPDLIQYQYMDDNAKKAMPIESKPYIKKDGEIFWEFYFELEKQPFGPGVKVEMENRARDEQWSFRDLRKNIQESKDENEHPMGFEARKEEKNKLINEIYALCKKMPVEKVRSVLSFCREAEKENYGLSDKEIKKIN